VRRLLALLPLVLVAAACGKGEAVKPLPSNTVKVTTTTAATVPAEYKNGDATAGKAVFTSAGCSGCHTLKAAGATGTVGPNLDSLKPPLSKVVPQVLNGGATMPPFKNQLTTKQIADVAAFVVKSTGGNLNG
jgi:mono/diheme cytochrome c family protein